MAVDETGKWFVRTLPVFGECLEANVVCEDHAALLSAKFEKGVIVQLVGALFGRRQDIHSAQSQLARDGHRDMDVHVKADCHQSACCRLIARSLASIGVSGCCWRARPASADS